MPVLKANKLLVVTHFDDEEGGGAQNTWFGTIYINIGDWVVIDELKVYGDVEKNGGRSVTLYLNGTRENESVYDRLKIIETMTFDEYVIDITEKQNVR